VIRIISQYALTLPMCCLLWSNIAIAQSEFYKSKTLQSASVDALMDDTYLHPRNQKLIVVEKSTITQNVMKNKQVATIHCAVGEPSAMIVHRDVFMKPTLMGDAYLQRLPPTDLKIDPSKVGAYKLNLSTSDSRALVVTLCATYSVPILKTPPK
jgi:hypothetical protein